MTRERWRMTLGELTALCACSPDELDTWADAGALGGRYRERPQGDRWSKLTKDAARRAILCARLVHAGAPLADAARATAGWNVSQPAITVGNGLYTSITIQTGDLP